MIASVLTGVGAGLLAGFFLGLRWVLRIVREALEEIAREEVKEELKASIPRVSLGLVRRAAQDLPESERPVVEDWEARLRDESARPLKMLMLAIQLYRNRVALAAEASEPVAELSTSAPRRWSVGRPQIQRLQITSRITALLSAIVERLRSHTSELRSSEFVDHVVGMFRLTVWAVAFVTVCTAIVNLVAKAAGATNFVSILLSMAVTGLVALYLLRK
jgi:hypothetical protein